MSTGRSSAGSSGERGPEWGWPGQGAQARPWLPALASNSKISLQTPSGDSPPPEPQAAEGLIVGGIIIETFKFCLQFQINRNELRDEVFEIFFAIEIRAGFKTHSHQAEVVYSFLLVL